MHIYDGRVTEICSAAGGMAAWIACPEKAIPAPGQYLLADDPGDLAAPLAVPLFAAQYVSQGFLAAPPVPSAWQPGTSLKLRGPLGHGFQVPAAVRRLGLVALGDNVARLLPLASAALDWNAEVVLYTDLPLTTLAPLPTSLEIYPLSGLRDGLAWADFLALDLPLDELPRLRTWLRLAPDAPLPCPAQALVATPMPCGGLADCGACAVPMRRGYQLACTDGPVFDLGQVAWAADRV